MIQLRPLQCCRKPWQRGGGGWTNRAPDRGVARIPGSKSITNRALLVAALAAGPSELSGVLNPAYRRLVAKEERLF